MGAYKDIRAEIVTVLQAVQLSGSAAFVSVSTNPTAKFTGYPAATVVPAEVTSEYSTVAQNERSYAYNIHLMFPVQGGWANAVDTMLDLMDACLDALDQTIDLNGKCDFLRAMPSQWDIEKSGEDLLLIATLQAIAVKDITVVN